MIALILTVLVAATALPAQVVNQTTPFSLELADESTSARACNRTESILGALDGPVPVKNGNMLFFSFRGYYLYDSSGTPVDSHVLSAESFDNGRRVAFPVDDSTMLFYRPDTLAFPPVRVFKRSLDRYDLREITPDEYELFGPSYLGRYMNIMHNTVFDDQTAMLHLKPHLVGYTVIDGGTRWWVLDEDPVLTAPLICKRDDGTGQLFPGLFECEGARLPAQGKVWLRSVFPFEEGYRYLGVLPPERGEKRGQTNQWLIVCDEAGNILYTESVLFAAAKSKRGPVRRGLFPVFDKVGRVLYATINEETCRLTVNRIQFARYSAAEVPAPPGQAFARDEDVTFEPKSILCGKNKAGAPEIPHVTFTGEDGQRRVARPADLERSGHVVRIARAYRRDVVAKVSRPPDSLPDEPARLCKEVAADEAVGCPYVLSLSGPDGFLRTFAYRPGDVVVCARVIGVAPDRTVGIRVDLADRAEMVLLDDRGGFVNRFTFNRQPYQSRKDVMSMRTDGALFEKDYEKFGSAAQHFIWTPDIKPQMTEW